MMNKRMLKHIAKNVLIYILACIFSPLIEVLILGGSQKNSVSVAAGYATVYFEFFFLFSFMFGFLFPTLIGFGLYFRTEVAYGATRKQAGTCIVLSSLISMCISVLLFCIFNKIYLLLGCEIFIGNMCAVNLYLIMLILAVIFGLWILKRGKPAYIAAMIFSFIAIEIGMIVHLMFEKKSLLFSPTAVSFVGSPVFTLLLAIILAAAVMGNFMAAKKLEVRV